MLEALLFGVVLPVLGWKHLMGFVIYVHHTEPDVAWYDDGAAWAASLPYLGATLHLQAPLLDALLHRILQNPAHHLDMTIPFYRLRAAQKLLLARRLTWAYYLQVARQCKLYDYPQRKWGRFPAPVRKVTGAAA